MSIRQDTKYRGRMVRRMFRTGLELTYDEPTGDDLIWKPVALTIPDIEVARADETPRNSPAYVLGWPKGYKGFPDDVYPGSRVEIAEQGVFEFLSPPRWLHEHNDRDGWTVLAQPLSFLYPIDGQLQEMGGNVIDDMILAMWNEDELQDPQGRYERMQAECPVDFDVSVNKRIEIDGRIWNIQEATKNYAAPRFQMVLRSPVNDAS